jgi:hypothetical protein
MQQYTDTEENFYLTANIVLNLVKKAYEIFQASEISEKRQFLNFLIQNLTLNGKKINFELKTPLIRCLKLTSVLRCSGGRIRTYNHLLNREPLYR